LPQVTDSFGSYRLASPSFFKQLVSGFAVTASLVCDEQGRTVSPLGSSKGLGNATDLELLIALRRQANVILTSGATFRADEYRFPRSADLAVLSRQSVDIEVPAGRKFHLIASGFGEAIDELLNRQYGRIHVEYGLAGITEVVAKGLLDFEDVKQAGDELAADIREQTFALKTPPLEHIFDFVYSDSHPDIDQQRAWLKAYEESMGAHE
jgi:hypothetical protein